MPSSGSCWLASWGWANIVFYGGAFHLFKIVLDSTRLDLKMLQSKFCWFQANEVVFHWGRLPLRLSSTVVVFHWGRLPLRSSSTEVVFHGGRLPYFQIIQNWFKLSSSVVVFHWGCLLLRSSSTEVSSTEVSSMEVVFPISKFFKIDLDSTRVDLPMLESKFCWFQANKVVFHWGRLPLRSSSTEVVFHRVRLPLMLFSTKFIFHWARLPRRSSSTEVVFHWGRLPWRSSSLFPKFSKLI